jgi:hypothetical protein
MGNRCHLPQRRTRERGCRLPRSRCHQRRGGTILLVASSSLLSSSLRGARLLRRRLRSYPLCFSAPCRALLRLLFSFPLRPNCCLRFRCCRTAVSVSVAAEYNGAGAQAEAAAGPPGRDRGGRVRETPRQPADVTGADSESRDSSTEPEGVRVEAAAGNLKRRVGAPARICVVVGDRESELSLAIRARAVTARARELQLELLVPGTLRGYEAARAQLT